MKPRRPQRRRNTTRELQTCTFQGPGIQKHHQNSTRRHQRDRKRTKWEQERGKKREILGPPPFVAPTTVVESCRNQAHCVQSFGEGRSSCQPTPECGGGSSTGTLGIPMIFDRHPVAPTVGGASNLTLFAARSICSPVSGGCVGPHPHGQSWPMESLESAHLKSLNRERVVVVGNTKRLHERAGSETWNCLPGWTLDRRFCGPRADLVHCAVD